MKSLVAIAGVLAVLGGPAAAQSTGIYIRGDVGAALGAPSTETDTNPGASNASLGNDLIWGTPGASVIFDFGVGYRFAPFLRFEGTIGYIPSMAFNGTFDSAPTVTARSTLSALVGMASGYLDFAGLLGTLPGNVQPFIVGGVGFANIYNGPEDDFVNGVYANTFSGNTMTNLAWSAGAGIGIPLSPRLMLDVTYRFIDLGERRVGPALSVAGTTVFLSQDRADLQVHTVMIGLRFAL